MRSSTFGAVALLAAWPLGLVFGGDSLKPANSGPREKGAIVDGTAGGVAVNDRSFTELKGGAFLSALFPVIPIGDFTASSGTPNEAIAFAWRRPPKLVPATWTPGNDTVAFTFENEYRIPVQVWILQKPFDQVRDMAIDGSLAASEIWATERQGVAFESFDIVDATNDPDADSVLEFNCGMDIKNKIGFVAGRINVYYVSTVDFGAGGGSGNGVACGLGVIAMGDTTFRHVLPHEIGHVFGLKHIDDLREFFDTENLMHHASNFRYYLTEGQTFLSVFGVHSGLNTASLYGPSVRPGAPTRNCYNTHPSTAEICPAVQKRIWPDGLWPPN